MEAQFDKGWHWSITGVFDNSGYREFGWGTSVHADRPVVGNFFRAGRGKAKILNAAVYRAKYGELWAWCRNPATDN